MKQVADEIENKEEMELKILREGINNGVRNWTVGIYYSGSKRWQGFISDCLGACLFCSSWVSLSSSAVSFCMTALAEIRDMDTIVTCWNFFITPINFNGG